MSKVAQYLQEHVLGEVTSSPEVRRYFSTDGSILQTPPAVVVYPRNEQDVRKVARFSWQLAERGRVLPITSRGSGTDQSGAAIGNGIMMVFPAHMNRIISYDHKSGEVCVEPGINYGKLQQTLQTHGRFLPPAPASAEYSTVGGAVANNAGGDKSFKYGDTRTFVNGLRVVLANGEVITAGRLNKRELHKKLGLSTFEGEIYRAVDALLEEHAAAIAAMARTTTKNAAGYDLIDIRRKDGSFDLTPLFVGSQGTLGIITEIMMDTEVENQDTVLYVCLFDSMSKAARAVQELRALPDSPAALEMIDDQLLHIVERINPSQLKDVIQKPFPKAVLLVEFDNPSERARKKIDKAVKHILDQSATEFRKEVDLAEREKLWKLRQASGTILSHAEGGMRALPVIEDGIVPPARLEEFIHGVYELFRQHRLNVAVWGHAGDAHLHLQPFFSLSELGDRQRVFRLMEDYYGLVTSLGGSTTGQHGDGRMRAPYLLKMYGPEAYEVFKRVKEIFDPYGTLNPGVKMGTSIEDLKALLRSDYSLSHLYDHMPRT